jgi:hypothetical protein
MVVSFGQALNVAATVVLGRSWHTSGLTSTSTVRFPKATKLDTGVTTKTKTVLAAKVTYIASV